MKISSQKPISIVYDALNVSKGLDVVGGASTQNYYTESNIYVPDRYILPLTLQPIAYITDVNNKITSGNKAGEFSSIRWYENDKLIAYGDEYKQGNNNSLIVYKNSSRDLLIRYEAEYLDPRKKQIIKLEHSVVLTCMELAESEGVARLVIDKPQNWVHNPLKGERLYTVKATLFASGEEAAPNGKWFISGVPAYQDLSFISQTNNTLVVDSDLIDTDLIECRVGNLSAGAKFIRKFPDSLEVDFIAPRKVRMEDQRVKAVARVVHRDGVVDNPSEYFFVTWVSRKQGAGARDTIIGYGNSVILSVAEFQTLRLDMESLDAYKGLKTEDDYILTDEDGKILIAR